MEGGEITKVGEITIIRMDDQGEYRAISSEESWKDSKSTELTGGEPICTFCGCEDSEKFEKMISLCHCNGGSVVAHPSCLRVFQADPRAGGNQVLILCKVCGGNGASSIGVDGMVSAVSVEGSSKSVDLNSSWSRETNNLTPKRVKHNPRDLINGGSGAAEQLENQPPLKGFKGESGRKIDRDDLSIAESEKLGVTVPVRRFDDAVVSVPIKKRKFWPPSPPPSSPKASSPSEPLYSEPPVSVIHSGRLSGTEKEQGPSNTHREQQVADSMDIVGESIQEKSVMLVGDMLNETRGKPFSSVDCFSQDTVGNVDISGLSTSTMDASMTKLVRNNLDERVSQAGYQEFENAKPVAVNLKDTGICSPEDQQHDNMHEDTQNQGGQSEREGHVLESNLLTVLPNKIHIGNGTRACNSSNESVDNIACGEETELALGRKSSLDSGRKSSLNSSNHSEIVLGIKVTSEAGECSQHKDGQKQEKGMLLKLNSGYFNDDRLHWDLNTPMDSWEKQAEAVTSDPEPKCSGKLPMGNAGDINSGCLDSIPVQIFVSEAKYDSRKPEQDMLSKGLQSEQNDHVVHSLEGLALDKDSVLDMTLGLQADALLNHHPVNSQSKLSRSVISKSLSISLDNPERNLDLSIANSGMPCEPAECISSTEVQDGKCSVESPDVILGKEPQLQRDEQTDAMLIDVNADTLNGPKLSPHVMHDSEPIEHGQEVSALTDAKGNLSCLPVSQEFPDSEQKSPPSLAAGKQDLNEIIDEDMNVDDTHTSVTCEVDAGAENIEIPGEKLGSPEGGLDKQSAEDAKEIAYGGDYESDGYDDEDELASDAEKFVELAEDENQGEEGEYRETELHDWIEEDAGEELEDEHVDYGDSDFRDADDLGMEQYDKGKDMEHERICDDIEKFEMDDQEAHDLQVGADGQVTIPETTTSGTGIEHSAEKETHKADGMISQFPELLTENKGLEIEPNCSLDMNKDFLRSREVRLSASSRSKSSGWDKLPEGFENVDEAYKAVHDIINKRGRGSSWSTAGRLGPMSARIPSSRIDAGFRERMTSDDSIHGKEFYMRGRDGNLSSPSFASRKTTSAHKRKTRSGSKHQHTHDSRVA